MSTEHVPDLTRVVCITVSFNPEMELLRRQFAALPVSSPKVLVDNASRSEVVRQIEDLVTTTPSVHLLRNSENLGLAAAINAGVEFAHANWPQAQFALLLDQDSEPRAGSIAALVEAFDSLQARGEKVGCVGPTLVDAVTGLAHGFHQCTRLRWKRVYPPPGFVEPVECANLNGSGTLVPIAFFLKLGGLDEKLFIDHVDTEWAFRVQAAGFRLYGIPQAVFSHCMGAASMRFWFLGWHVWPARSPARHYFLFRNAVILMRRSYVPRVWKVWAMAKLWLTFLITLVWGPARLAQIRNMSRGIWDGYKGGRKARG